MLVDHLRKVPYVMSLRHNPALPSHPQTHTHTVDKRRAAFPAERGRRGRGAARAAVRHVGPALPGRPQELHRAEVSHPAPRPRDVSKGAGRPSAVAPRDHCLCGKGVRPMTLTRSADWIKGWKNSPSTRTRGSSATAWPPPSPPEPPSPPPPTSYTQADALERSLGCTVVTLDNGDQRVTQADR